MKDNIKKLLREGLVYHGASITGVEDDEYEIGPLREETTESFSLTQSDMNRYINIGLKSAYDSKEMAHKGLMNLLNGLKKLSSNINLYRVIFLNSVDDLNTKQLGSHYMLNKNSLENAHYSDPHNGANGNPYIVTIKAPKSLIDFDSTIVHNMGYPHETEITLKDNGNGIKIINVEPFEDKEFDMGTTYGLDDDEFDYNEPNTYRN